MNRIKSIITFASLLLPIITFAQNSTSNIPSGGTITIISISVVFSALIILYFFYFLAGKFFTGELKAQFKSLRKCKKSKKSKDNDEEIALAITMALEKENNSEVNAAIAMAMHQYINDCIHDDESYVLSIQPKDSAWANKLSTLRISPNRINNK